MRFALFSRASLLASLTLVAACGSPAARQPAVGSSLPSVASAGPAPYRAVHIDSLAPDKVAQFEDARRAFVDELHRAHAADRRGLFMKAGDDRFYTIRSFTKFSEFDTRLDTIIKAMEGVSKAAADRYDELSDSALVFPHASEIWRLDTDLAYAPDGGALTEETAACGRMVIEDARPDPKSEERYDEAWKETKKALAEVHYPLTRVTFRSMYGAGHLVTLWLARSKEALDAAPAVDAALAQARGAVRAAELAAAFDAAVAHREVRPLTIRQDLSSF